ncbi:TPR-like protein [Linderina pennispora]|uniref:TPR-like protein n=1 Tax=Linderina pennispora TaxID=61395 RepID=A0A1Y1VY24_9FUNG|nr:TPR-like protein [Linderina pennispora]ORX66123.1 TPR-like protein [Linderina pennispora]
MAGLNAAGFEQNVGSTDMSADDGTVTNFMAIGQARDDVLRMKLDQAGDSATGQTTIDPRGYLTSLNTLGTQNAAEIGDISRARTLLKSRPVLEEIAKKLGKARSIIAEGCENCPKSEEVWLEAARLNTRETAKVILASAVRNLPQSVKVWMAAADLEAASHDVKAQRRVLRRALEFVPTSVVLWKAALIPLSIDLWLALARLETYEKAQKVLNRARRAVPSSHEVWIAAARLEEQNEHTGRSLGQHGTTMDRDAWLDQAEICETDGYPSVCQAIVKATASLGFDGNESAEDQADVWASEADRFMQHRAVVTARSLYELALEATPASMDMWRSAADLEREQGSIEDLEALLKRAVQYCPQAEVLWLIAAKEKWTKQNDVEGARQILEEAFRANSGSEAIVLAAVKLESENGQYQRAQLLLQRARTTEFDGQMGTARIWMKSTVLLRQLDDLDTALSLAKEGLDRFPQCYKLWLVQSQIEIQMEQYEVARQTLSNSLKHSPHLNLHIRARAILERARVYNPKSPRLWLEQARLEADVIGNVPVARTLLSRALQECPKSGLLWAESILLEQRPQRKAKDDPAITCMIARLFWSERRIEKARTWFERAAAADQDYGDAWAWWLKFEVDQAARADEQLMLDERIKAIEDACMRADPHHGQVWPVVSKDPKNARLSTRDILHKVSERLGQLRQL